MEDKWTDDILQAFSLLEDIQDIVITHNVPHSAYILGRIIAIVQVLTNYHKRVINYKE